VAVAEHHMDMNMAMGYCKRAGLKEKSNHLAAFMETYRSDYLYGYKTGVKV